jgi:hypothetical protein
MRATMRMIQMRMVMATSNRCWSLVSSLSAVSVSAAGSDRLLAANHTGISVTRTALHLPDDDMQGVWPGVHC